MAKRTPAQKAYLAESIKLLRRFAKGYEASKGYDLRKLNRLRPAQVARIAKNASILRQETGHIAPSGPLYRIVRPRTTRGRKAVEAFTGQTAIPRRKAYVVPIERPWERVRLVSKVIQKDQRKRRVSNVEVFHTVKGERFYNRYYRFPERPQNWIHIRSMLEAMLPEMPRGWYVLETSNHGAIYVPIHKQDLMREIDAYFTAYDRFGMGGDNRGLAETVIGLRLIGSTVEHARRYQYKHETNAIKMTRFRASVRAKQRRRALARFTPRKHK